MRMLNLGTMTTMESTKPVEIVMTPIPRYSLVRQRFGTMVSIKTVMDSPTMTKTKMGMTLSTMVAMTAMIQMSPSIQMPPRFGMTASIKIVMDSPTMTKTKMEKTLLIMLEMTAMTPMDQLVQ